MTLLDRASRICLSLACVGLLASCASKGPAPVESRAVPGSLPAEQRSATGRPLGSLEPVGKGQYRVRRGDTLYSIAVDHNADWKDLARWNKLSNPNVIEPGQVLWVADPSPRSGPALAQSSAPPASGAQAQPIAPSSGVGVRPLQSQPPSDPQAAGGTGMGSSAMADPPAAASSTADPAAPVASTPPTELASIAPAATGWVWPANGQIISGFAEGGSKGLSIAGAPGEAIFAAETGKVVYSGSGLRGYGNLVIVKHEQDVITAYAHNRAILVKEGQTVRRGQKIAELGMSDADRPMLLFEVRKGGKPVDPMTFLPTR
ncbi:MAG: peptidoglycan DD-metalloendopeptidase family protein [Burkholderiaceae bacterium]